MQPLYDPRSLGLYERLWRLHWLRLNMARLFFRQVPHGRQLGFRVVALEGSTLTTEMPYSREVVGDPRTGVIHGGAVLTLVDQTSGAIATLSTVPPDLVATLDLRLDYLRPAIPGRSVRAIAECYRVSRQIVFVRCTVEDGDPSGPVATSTSTFMRTTPLVANPVKRLGKALREWLGAKSA